jgi:hypothetical protein
VETGRAGHDISDLGPERSNTAFLQRRFIQRPRTERPSMSNHGVHAGGHPAFVPAEFDPLKALGWFGQGVGACAGNLRKAAPLCQSSALEKEGNLGFRSCCRSLVSYLGAGIGSAEKGRFP